MAYGEGKYDPECMAAMTSSRAEATLLIVLGGDRGTGFSLTTKSMEVLGWIPRMLRDVADQIEIDVASESVMSDGREP
jgi:hypothetical protein